MIWAIIVLLTALSAGLSALVVKVLCAIPWSWVRWTSFVFLLIVSAYATIAGTVLGLRMVRFYPQSTAEIFSSAALAPTARLLIITFFIGSLLSLTLIGTYGISLDHSSPRRPRARRWRITRLTTFIACTGILLLAVCLWNDIRIRTRIQALETRAEFIARNVAPSNCSDAENAATVWETLVVENLPRPVPDRQFFKHPETLRNDEWSGYLAEHRLVTERIRGAAGRPRCRFDSDWLRANMLAERPELEMLSNAMLLLHAEGLRAAFDGDAGPAFANAAALRHIAEQLTDDPRRHAQMSLGMAEGRACSLLGQALYMRPPTAEEFAELKRGNLEIWKNNPRVVSWSEAEHYNAVRDMYVEGSVQRANPTIPGHRAALRTSLAISRLFFADDDIRAVPEHFAEFQDLASGSVEDFGKSQSWSKRFPSTGGLVCDRLVFFEHLVSVQPLRIIATRNICDLALQIAQQDLISSILGNGPDQAIPAEMRPTDPFDGQPLRVAICEGGVVIYSIWLNGKDDGGKFDQNADDMTFELGEAFKVRRLTSPDEKNNPTDTN